MKKIKLPFLFSSFLSLFLFTLYLQNLKVDAQSTISDGLVAYWNFDEGQGSVAKDTTANVNDAALINGPVWGEGKLGGGISFDGINDYLKILDSPSLKITGDLTISVWIKPESLGTRQHIVSKFYSGEYNLGFISETPPYPMRYIQGSGSSYIPGQIINSISSNEWQHIALVRTMSNKNVKGYRNGNFETGWTYTVDPPLTTNNVAIGARSDGAEPFKGSIDEVRIYNRALNDDEIASLASQGDTTPPTISITSPSEAATVSGILSVSANAGDNVKIASVQFILDGSPLGNEIKNSPYITSLDTKDMVNDSTHTLLATAKDYAGNTATSSAVTFIVDNPAPVVSKVVSNSINTTSMNITWVTDKLSTSKIEYGADSSYGQNTSEDTLAVKTHTINIFNLSPGTTYHYRVVSKSGNQIGYSTDTTFATPVSVGNWHVTTTGSASANGSEANPWNLQAVLSGRPEIKPGDTIWVHGGTYTGTFTSYLNGTNGSPIIVRAIDGERVTIDSASLSADPIMANGSYTWFWGIEITNSNTNRYTPRPGGVEVYGHHINLINMIIHDTGDCIGHWRTGVTPSDAHIYGNIIYYCGWEEADRGHGHGIYIQNTNLGFKDVRDNIIFKDFGWGIHAYTEGGNIDNLEFYGNTSFLNGALSAVRPITDNILFGGLKVAQNPVLVNNFTYYPVYGRNTLGYSAGTNNAIVDGNYFVSGNPGTALALLNNTNITITNNKIYGNGISSSTYPNNTFYSSKPTGVWTFVEPNLYEPKHANITVYNWDNSPSIVADISKAGFTVGDIYQIIDTQNIFGDPIAAGKYTGVPIPIPMTSTSVSVPVGTVAVPPTHSTSEFGSFRVMPAVDTTPPTINITTPTNNSEVMGTIQIQASASDNIDINKIEFKLDGNLLGEDTSAPYSYSWNTLTIPNGSHQLSAIAYDTAGNQNTSSVTISVNNDTTSPTISITSPRNGSWVKGIIDITTQSTDNIAVVSTLFKLDGQDIVNPWDTRTTSQGAHTLLSVAKDAAGNSGTSNPISINVDNIAPAKIVDLRLGKALPNSANLWWTTPGDDANTGIAARYDLRYSKTPITALNFVNATKAVNEPAPKVPGQQQFFSLPNLSRSTTYYVALKTIDKVGNISLISNIIHFKTKG